MDLGIELSQEADHAHMLRIVDHGGVIIFGRYEIYRHHARIGRRNLKPEQGLGKDELLRCVSEHFIDVPNLHFAGRRLIRLTAMPAPNWKTVVASM